MGRLANSWRTFKISFGVVKQDPELMWLPVLSMLASVIMFAAVAGVGVVSGIWPEVTDANGNVDPASAALAFALYLALAFVQVFFYAAMVQGANERLGGGDPTVGSALRAASAHTGRLFLWSIVVATVNILLQALRERGGNLGRIAASFAGAAWNLATYFVVPILMFEDKGIGASLKRSGGLFKQTWGETVAGQFGIGWVAAIATVLTVIVGVVLIIALGMLHPIGALIGIVVLVLGLIVLTSMFSVVGAVYKTELYRFSSQGKHDPHFEAMELQRAFVHR